MAGTQAAAPRSWPATASMNRSPGTPSIAAGIAHAKLPPKPPKRPANSNMPSDEPKLVVTCGAARGWSVLLSPALGAGGAGDGLSVARGGDEEGASGSGVAVGDGESSGSGGLAGGVSTGGSGAGPGARVGSGVGRGPTEGVGVGDGIGVGPRSHDDGDGGGISRGAVRRGVGEGCGTGEPGWRIVANAAGLDRSGAHGRGANRGDRERVPVDVGVVGENVDQDRGLMGRRLAVRAGHGGVVHRRDGEGHRCRVRAGAVVRRVRERIGAVEVGVGDVRQAPR